MVEAEPNNALPEVKGNRVQLQQVLLNLIMNAIHALTPLLFQTWRRGGAWDEARE